LLPALVFPVQAAPEPRDAASSAGTVPAVSSAAGGAETNLLGAGVASNRPLSELDKMKTEYIELMQKRGGLQQRAKAGEKLIVDRRNLRPGAGSGAGAVTGEAYRKAALAVEGALDNHPRIKALQAEYELAESNKLAVSRQQADLANAWDGARSGAWKERNSAEKAAKEKADAEWKALFKAAGVREGDVRKLTEADLKVHREIHSRMTNELAIIKARYAVLSDTNAVRLAREKDGSEKRFHEANEQYAELERQQADLKARMNKLRTELRKSDAEVAALQAAAGKASHEHMAAIDSAPDVAAARAFLDSLPQLREAIDSRARILRRSILAADPDSKGLLDRHAVAGGLALVGEDFWEIDP